MSNDLNMEKFTNPFRPGAGQLPLYLAGRQDEQNEFRAMLKEDLVMRNLILTGLRGVGKTVLLETLKPLAIKEGWLWAGTDLSESASISEQNLAIRIIADISTLISGFPIETKENSPLILDKEGKSVFLGNFDHLIRLYSTTPGLSSDKLKAVLEFVWSLVKTKAKAKGIVLAYDEAQILKDQAVDKQYPLSLLLEVIQFLQRKQIPYLLVLTGLPTLFPNLVESRTYAERMFHILTLEKLDYESSKQAVTEPIRLYECPITFTDNAVEEIVRYSGGYPYFIQFLGKEIFDSYLQQKSIGIDQPIVTIPEVVRKLDTDFYYGRWARLTDKQRDLMRIIAQLDIANDEFSIQDILEKSKKLNDVFSASYINQILQKLGEAGLIYKNRHGKYSFAVPMISDYVKRQMQNTKQMKSLLDEEV